METAAAYLGVTCSSQKEPYGQDGGHGRDYKYLQDAARIHVAGELSLPRALDHLSFL